MTIRNPFLRNVIEDTTPQAGGDFDFNSKRVYDIKVLDFKAPSELTLDTNGAMTVTQTFHTVDTFEDAASDDLVTINGSSNGRLLVIKAVNDARTVVVKHNTGNIWLQGKLDISLDDISDGLMLVYSSTDSKWFDISAGQTHAMLDGVIHTDSVADAVTRGSVIYGNSTPKWDELVLGLVDTFLGSDGTDLSYRTAAQVLASLSGEAGATFSWNDKILSALKGQLFTTATELTMDTDGAITVTQMVHTVDTFEDAASDDLVTINGGTTVGLIVIRPANGARTVVVKDGGGNIELLGGADITLDDITDHVMLLWDTTNSKWVDVGGGVGAGIGNVVEDITPQLGGDLDAQTKRIYDVKVLDFKAPTELTIDTGAITVTQTNHLVDTESDAASDDLVTINGGSDGRLIVLKAANDARTIVFKHNTGNIWLQGKADISLDDISDGIMLVYSDTDSKWFDIAAGGGGGGIPTYIEDGTTKFEVESTNGPLVGTVAGVEVSRLSAIGVLTLAKQSSVRAYLATSAQSIPPSAGGPMKIRLNAENWDYQNEFDSSVISGTADATAANKLHDADGGFSSADVGKIVWNTTDNTYTTVSGYVDAGELDITADIMISGEGYTLYFARFTAKEAGVYALGGMIAMAAMEADKRSLPQFHKNGAQLAIAGYHSSHVASLYGCLSDIVELAANDYIELLAYHDCAAAKNAYFGSTFTYLAVSKIA